MTRVRRVLSAVAAAATISVVGMPGASAASTDEGMLRLAHLSPDTPAVDVYVDSVSAPGVGITLPGVDYGTISDYQALTAGTYAVSMRKAGAPATSPPVLSTTVQVDGDSASTVAGLGKFADLGLTVLDDDLAAPPAGQTRVRLISAASAATSLDVSVSGTPVATGLAFAKVSDYVAVPAGSTALHVTNGAGAPVDLPVDLAAGSVYSLVVLDGPSGLTVRTAVDAASPGVVPVGGVETGAGGTATDPTAPVGRLALAVLAVLAVAVTLWMRLPRRARAPRHAAR
jgi:hypothetical protein